MNSEPHESHFTVGINILILDLITILVGAILWYVIINKVEYLKFDLFYSWYQMNSTYYPLKWKDISIFKSLMDTVDRQYHGLPQIDICFMTMLNVYSNISSFSSFRIKQILIVINSNLLPLYGCISIIYIYEILVLNSNAWNMHVLLHFTKR